MKKIICFFLFFSQFAVFVSAQNKKEGVAVLPFTSDKKQVNDAKTLTGYVETAFVKANRFDMVDRTTFSRILIEDSLQRNPDLFESMAIDESKKLGAKYLVIGHLSESSAGTTNKQEITKMIVGTDLTLNRPTGKIPFSLKIINVETGKIMKSENFVAEAKAMKEKNALAEAMLVAEKQIDNFIGKTFPVIAKYYKMQDGKIKIVGGSKIGFQKDQLLKVVEVNQVEVDGEMLTEEAHLATLKIVDVENENFSICKIEKVIRKGVVLDETFLKQPNIFIKSGAEK